MENVAQGMGHAVRKITLRPFERTGIAMAGPIPSPSTVDLTVDHEVGGGVEPGEGDDVSRVHNSASVNRACNGARGRGAEARERRGALATEAEVQLPDIFSRAS